MKTFKQLKTPVGDYNELKIEVEYTLGGMNYFSGKTNKRGYKLYLTPCSRATGFMQTTLMGSTEESGFYILLEEVTRLNKKRQEHWWSVVEPLTDKIADLYSERKFQEIIDLFDITPSWPEEPKETRYNLLTDKLLRETATPKEDNFIAKFFNPIGTWFVKEVDEYRLERNGEYKSVSTYSEAQDLINHNWVIDDIIFFGWAKITDGEYGCFSLKELETTDKPIMKVERDKYFTATRCEEIINQYK